MRRPPRGARKLALKAKLGAQDLRARVDDRIAALRPTLPLERIQRRLELLITALYGRPVPIAPGDSPAVHGDSIRLPSQLPAKLGDEEALSRYKLYAIEQVERLTRGTAAVAPSDDPLVRDLYLVAESAAIDAHIARSQPGLRDVLVRERASALEKRPRIGSLTAPEREVESLLRSALDGDPSREQELMRDPESSLEWARSTADRVRNEKVAYRGVQSPRVWGDLPSSNARPNDWRREHARPMEKMAARQFSWGRMEAESEAARGKTVEPAGKYNENRSPSAVPDEQRKDAPTEERAGTSDRPSPNSGPRTASAPTMALEQSRKDLEGLPPAIWYDEWDVYAGSYRKRVAGVRLTDMDGADDAWAQTTLREHAALVRKVRHQFERLRARRMLLPRQRSGDEIDIAAVVSAMTDRHIGEGGDERLYMAARPARRGLAIALLVDASGSTKAHVADGRTIIDLERIALLLACEALDALGDRYSAFAFAGKSAENVRLTCIKDFDEQSGPAVKQRIGALKPGGFTRLGAAVRHVTRSLAAQTAGHRLLLLLSDGKPNDVDWYQGDFGIEDSRQAILEARASGVYPFCLTIDAEAAEYVPRIFGTAGHTILTRAEQLPTALLGVVRGLIRQG